MENLLVMEQTQRLLGSNVQEALALGGRFFWLEAFICEV